MPPMEPLELTAAQARVLGALLEKEVTTPEYYPLSLHALVNACNQRSNREPVMTLDEDEVRMALHGLEGKGLAGVARGADGRVSKYEHWLGEAFNLSRAETALLCVLLLRGPQTPGELRSRAEPPLAAILPRQPGTKEARYTHLLARGAEPVAETHEDATTPDADTREERMARLEQEIAEVREQLDALRKRIDDLFA